MSRSPGARNSRGPRDHSANPANRVSVQYHIYHDSKNIDYFANKRGIIRCQAWRLQVIFQKMNHQPILYLAPDTETKDVRTLFKNRTSQAE